MSKLGRIIYYSIIVVLTIVFAVILVKNSYSGSAFGLGFGITLGVIAVLGVIVSSILYLVNNPKNAKNMLIGAAVLIAVCVISYLVAPGNVIEHHIKYGVETVKMSKTIDMGLYLTAFLAVVSVGSILLSEGVALFKN